ncbi:MAG: S41 family peptidase [Lachnospira sp.]
MDSNFNNGNYTNDKESVYSGYSEGSEYYRVSGENKGPDYNGNRKTTHFGSGVFTGVIATVMVFVMVISIVVTSLIKSGRIHIGENGEIYVQSVAIDDSDGIGSAIENKLNTLESLLDQYYYFEDVDDNEAADNIFKAYLASYGDKYTVYYTPDEYKALMETTSGTFYGIGCTCQKTETGEVKIVEVYEDCSGYKAGLRQGDLIIKVDDTDVKDMDLAKVTSLIKGEKGTQVKLLVNSGGVTNEIVVTRDEVKVQTVKYSMMESQIGYIAIAEFEDPTFDQFKTAVEDLESQGAKSLIIDVRGNPGGLLSSVCSILEYVLPDGLLVYTQTKNGTKNEYSGSDGHEVSLPIAVLVNGNSASASEIFAGAMQDYDKGEIIGTKTYGKGIVQTVRPLTDGSAVKFTISRYFTPKGQDIHGVGIIPDVVVEASDTEEDVQLNAAVEYVKSQY